MGYEKQTWIDGKSPINAERMNHMEGGIEAAHAELSSLSEEIAKQPTSKPLVYIDGAVPTSNDDYAQAEMWYKNGAESWHAYIEIKWQGSSSLAYPKKNFTVKLYEDEERTVKMKRKMFGWPVAQHKYVLKANWIDHTHARNIVTARLWSEVVASRPDYDLLPAELRNSPNNGAIDGSPIIVYYNGNYEGLYTWNIGKDAWMWGMDEDNPNHVLLCGEVNTTNVFAETSCNFRKLWSGYDGGDWSVEVGANSESVSASLNALISCVKDTSLADFKAQIEQYIDVQSAIDYYLFACCICGIDSLAKNMLLATYDLKTWIMGAYDLDSTWGLFWHGGRLLDADLECPYEYQEKYSLLFSRIKNAYWREMKTRGAELRKTVLSYANIVSHFERFCDVIGRDAYADDLVPYPSIPSADVNNIWQIRNFVRDRLNYFDGWIAELDAAVECTGITLDNTEIEFGALTPRTLVATVSPYDCTEPVQWSVSDADVLSVEGGVVTPKQNGNATITAVCGAKIAICAATVGVNTGDGGTLIYSLPNETTFTGAVTDVVDTGVKLHDTDKDYTITLHATPAKTDAQVGVVFTTRDISTGAEVQFGRHAANAGNYYVQANGGYMATLDIPQNTEQEFKVVLVHTAGSNAVTGLSKRKGTEIFRATSTYTAHKSGEATLAVGGNRSSAGGYTQAWTGVVHEFSVYDGVMTDDEINAYLADS